MRRTEIGETDDKERAAVTDDNLRKRTSASQTSIFIVLFPADSPPMRKRCDAQEGLPQTVAYVKMTKYIRVSRSIAIETSTPLEKMMNIVRRRRGLFMERTDFYILQDLTLNFVRVVQVALCRAQYQFLESEQQAETMMRMALARLDPRRREAWAALA